MFSPVHTASAGLIAPSERIGAASVQIASLGTSPALLPNAAQVSLSDAAMGLIGPKTGFSINLAVLSTTMRMDQQVVDLLV